MANLLLSEGEKVFMKNGIKLGIRQDGRGLEDFRSIEVETGVVPHCFGSARVKLANTDVMVGVKAEITEPSQDNPKNGKLHFFADCSAIATPDFEGQGGSELAESLSSTLERLYSHRSSLDLSPLCIVEGKKCWCLYVDILLIEIGGNLYDAVSMAVKAALYNTRLPNVSVVSGEHGDNDLELSDDPSDLFALRVDLSPCMVSLSKVGEEYIVDASLEEDTCVTSRLIVGVKRDGEVVMVKKDGVEGLEVKKLASLTQMASRIGKRLNDEFMHALEAEQQFLSPAHKLNDDSPQHNRSISGFIK